MPDLIYGLLILGILSGIIPILSLLLLIKVIIFIVKGMSVSAKVLAEKEPPKPVKRNVREEIWEEREQDALTQWQQEVICEEEN